MSGPLYGAKEFPVATNRARAIFRPAPATPSHRPLAYRLRKLREFQDPGSGRPALGLEIGITLAETAETHFSSPIAVRKYSWGRHWKEKWHDRRPARQLVGSFGRPWRSPASNQKIPNRFNAGKPQPPGHGAYLFRPSASQSSDRDAQVGMFEIEVLARRHARQLHPARGRDGESDGVTTHSPHPEERPQAASRRMGNITTGPILRDAARSLPRGYSRGAAPQDEAGLRQPIDLPRRAAEQCRLIGRGRARRHQLEGVP